MFTGLVEEIGTVKAVDSLGDALRITIEAPLVTQDARHGDSISVNGCCLTVIDPDPGVFSAEVMHETIVRTSLAGITVGDRVNLERAVTAATRLGGHIVQGHVDATGELLERQPSQNWEVFRFSVPPELAKYLVEKGSITVDGTSLTIVEVRDEPTPWFSVSLIPTTLNDTILGAKSVGDRVNLEVDVIAKYVERLLDAGKGPQS